VVVGMELEMFVVGFIFSYPHLCVKSSGNF
jgi:hypothetical protein